ncbi:MAG: acetyltransferase [Acidobacteriota bacterium]
MTTRKATRLAILGAGDLGRQLAHHARATGGFTPTCFYDDTLATDPDAPDARRTEVDGLPVVGPLARSTEDAHAGRFDAALLGIGYRHLAARERLFDELEVEGLPFATLVHPSCIVDPAARIGPGSVLYPGCIVDAGVTLEPNVLLNLGCVVAHDSTIGAHSFLAPGVQLAGCVEVGRRSFLGIGTVVIDHVRLGDDLRTGGGAVVVADDPGDSLLVGVPARRVG